jgi:hypothetical protein
MFSCSSYGYEASPILSRGENGSPELIAELAHEPEPWLVRKACHEFHSLRIAPKHLRLFKVQTMLGVIALAFVLVILKLHDSIIPIP